MAGEWVERAIGDLGEVVGGSTPSTSDQSNFDGEIPWLTPKDLSGSHDRYVRRGERNITMKGLTSCSARLLPANTVLLSSRAPIGYVAIAANPITTNQGFRSIVLKKDYDHEFLYYWLVANLQELERHASGSTFRELSGGSLRKIRLRLPSDLSEQRAIAHILGSLDDKIELNRRMNEMLEAIARAIFKDWFVDFGPTRAKMEGRPPYLTSDIWSLFPDRLDDEDKPDGWLPGVLGDIAGAPRTGVAPSDVQAETPYIGLEHMPRRCIALSEWENAWKVTSAKSRFRRGDFLFGKLRPYFHKVGIAAVDGICSTDIVVICARTPQRRAFTISCVSSDEFVDFTDRTSTGTKMPRTSWDVMAHYKIIMPTAEIATAFDAICWPMIERIEANIYESRILAAMRDLLLPKLISGEIRLRDAERAVGAAA